METSLLLERAQTWMSQVGISDTDRASLETLIEGIERPSEREELEESFYRELEFGTGGLRAPLGLGPNRMNAYNVKRATAALCSMLREQKNKTSASLAVAYDSRKCSKEFARHVCEVVAGQQGQAYIFACEAPTPLLSFAVRHLNLDGGVVVTASHNPKNYNGFKAYWSDGHQITPPYDRQTIEHFRALEDIKSIPLADFEKGVQSARIQYVGDEVIEAYYNAIFRSSTLGRTNLDAKLAYSPLHGTGALFAEKLASKAGMKHFHMVAEQSLPDPEFPSVRFPNPEDPKALKKTVELMLAHQLDAAVASDPDADRMGVVINTKHGERFLNGNELGVLLLYHRLATWKKDGKLTPHSLVLKSIVTTPLIDELCRSFEVECATTLTGFKWMGAELLEREQQGRPVDFVFATEESYGFLPHDSARDKDGIAAILGVAEAIDDFKKQGKDCVEVLNDIYAQFGEFREDVMAFTFEGQKGMKIIDSMTDYLRNVRSDSTDLPASITERIDLASNERADVFNGISLTALPQSNVVGVKFSDEMILWCRPSGTEPKIKFYLMVKTAAGEKQRAEQSLKTLQQFVRQTVKRLKENS